MVFLTNYMRAWRAQRSTDIYILFMFPKNIIAPISGKYALQSKQKIEQATMAILGVSVFQTKPAPLFTEASEMKTGYFLLRYSVNLINPKCFSAKIQHSKAALVSELRH